MTVTLSKNIKTSTTYYNLLTKIIFDFDNSFVTNTQVWHRAHLQC